MENATHALYMAFAVMVFVIALSVAMLSFNSVKQVADVLVYAQDETNYYEYQGAKGKAAENRIVGLETIIPTLYKYYKENYTVVFKEGTYDFDTGEIDSKYLPVYYSKSTNWQARYKGLMKKRYIMEEEPDNKIFSFDLDEETLRHEPWTGSYSKIKDNLDCFLYGGVYKNPNNNTLYIDYSKDPLKIGGFIGKYKNDKFVETITEYDYSSDQSISNEGEEGTEDGSTISSLVKQKKKRMVIFTLITNNN